VTNGVSVVPRSRGLLDKDRRHSSITACLFVSSITAVRFFCFVLFCFVLFCFVFCQACFICIEASFVYSPDAPIRSVERGFRRIAGRRTQAKHTTDRHNILRDAQRSSVFFCGPSWVRTQIKERISIRIHVEQDHCYAQPIHEKTNDHLKCA
jgi:hypothetical protein